MDIVEEDAELVILQLGKGATEELRGKPHLLIGDLRYWLHQVITGNIRESVGLSKSGEVVKSLLKAGPANDEQRLMTRELMRRTVTTVEFRYKPY